MTGRSKLVLATALSFVAIFFSLRVVARRATADGRFKGNTAQRIFDPSRNALDDLQLAEQQAEHQHKNILMDVGGNWCPSCLLMDRTISSDAGLHELLQRNFVFLHVNWSSDNQNRTLLKRYPEAHGYPAFYVLASTGQLIHAEDTVNLEQPPSLGAGYSHAALETFLTRYDPH